MRTLARMLFGAGAVCAVSAALAQSDSIKLTTVQDIPVMHGYGQSKFDIIGLRFGDLRADAIATVAKAFPDAKVNTLNADIRLADNRGNQIAVEYQYAASVQRYGTTESESVALGFTSALTGGRVYAIDRDVLYSAPNFADMASLRAAIREKYGEPTYIARFDHQNHIEIFYTWEKRPVQKLGEEFVQQRKFNQPDPHNINPCLGVAYQRGHVGANFQAYPPGARADNPGRSACIGGVRFTIFFGPNPNTVRRLRVEATDYDRMITDARLLDAALAKLLSEKAQSVQGAGRPRL